MKYTGLLCLQHGGTIPYIQGNYLLTLPVSGGVIGLLSSSTITMASFGLTGPPRRITRTMSAHVPKIK